MRRTWGLSEGMGPRCSLGGVSSRSSSYQLSCLIPASTTPATRPSSPTPVTSARETPEPAFCCPPPDTANQSQPGLAPSKCLPHAPSQRCRRAPASGHLHGSPCRMKDFSTEGGDSLPAPGLWGQPGGTGVSEACTPPQSVSTGPQCSCLCSGRHRRLHRPSTQPGDEVGGQLSDLLHPLAPVLGPRGVGCCLHRGLRPVQQLLSGTLTALHNGFLEAAAACLPITGRCPVGLWSAVSQGPSLCGPLLTLSASAPGL